MRRHLPISSQAASAWLLIGSQLLLSTELFHPFAATRLESEGRAGGS
jgi:hypothetical protein